MKTCLYSCAFLLLLLAMSIPGLGQTAELRGLVADPSGSIIPKASVSVVNEATGIERQTATTDSGYYVVTNLSPGDYRISVTAPGFSPHRESGIHLAVQQTARLDVTMTVGSVSESVQVQANAALLNTSDATLGYVVENKRVVDLPLKGRQFLEFALLGPGVNGGKTGDVRASQQGVAISANGLYTKNNNFLLDGADNNESYQNQFSVAPSVDAVEEFKVQTGLYPAEYGRGGGAVISIVTKSGTNAFHGVFFEFLRNDIFDARNYFAQPTDRKPPLRRNQFGGSLGGPIKKNQTFFFVNYDGTRQSTGSVTNQNVPTAAQRSGDFSSSAAILDPTTQARFPGNIIPANRITQVAQNLLQYYPLPNQPAGARTNYYAILPARTNVDSGIVKIDHRFSDRDSLFGRYGINQTYSMTPGAVPLAGGSQENDAAHGATLNWTHLFSSTRLNVLALSYNRFIQDGAGQNSGTPIAANAGITGITDNPRDVGFPESLNFSAGSGFASVGEMSTRIRKINTYQIQNSTTFTTGAHTIKFGGEYRWLQANVLQTSALQGNFTFNGQYTGNGFAEFLLGTPSATATSLNAGLVYPRRKSTALFVQDDWNATPRLTVNLGLRWEFNAPVTDARGQLSAFDYSTGEIVFPKNANLGSFYTSVRPDLKYRKFDTNSVYDAYYKNFAPRLGLAWRPFGDSKTVLRTGGGIFILSPELNSSQNTGNSPPFQLRMDATGNRGIPNLSWNLGGDLSALQTAQFGIFTFNADRKFRDGQVLEWMAEVQHEFAGDWVAKVGYVGNKGVHLDTHLVRNQLPPGPGTAASRRVFPQWARIRSYESDGWSDYHALQSSLEKRFGQGFTLFASYTYSKTMDFGWTQDICCQQDINNLAAENALASQDQRHRVTANGMYELPFGRGRRFGTNTSPLVSKIIGGWRVGALLTLASGLPANPSISGNPDNVPDNTDRPNRVANGNIDDPTVDRWWDPTAFQRQALYTFGNSGRNVLIAPGTRTANVVFTKSTQITESQRVEFRAELFNFTNTPNFGVPTTDVANPNFGKIFSAGPPRQLQFGLKYYF
jgi:outer membrane receptor protein involved in Fe transport